VEVSVQDAGGVLRSAFNTTSRNKRETHTHTNETHKDTHAEVSVQNKTV
jgi:hypothetical protein